MSETTDRFHSEIVPKIKAARRVGTPIVAINTPDQPALVDLLVAALNGKSAMYSWDYVRGLCGRNEKGTGELATLGFTEPPAAREPIDALAIALRLPIDGVVFYFNAHRFVQDAGVCQGLMNLRDRFKGDDKMIVLVGTGIKLPPEIATDVVQFTEDLPTVPQLTEIVTKQIAAVVTGLESKNDKAGAKKFSEAVAGEPTKQAAVALRGCSAFGAEQLAAMSLTRTGIDAGTLHSQAKAVIETTDGLTFEVGKETFDDIGGLAFAKEWGRRLFKGPRAPAIVVRMEEIEKAMMGSKGDLSGTSSDALQVMLSSMEDYGWSGILAYGPPGCSKSLFAKSLANTHGVKPLVFDINACKGSLVGESERKIRKAVQIINTLGGDRVLFVASCNALDNLPAALQRRFRMGVWFFDIPDDEERKVIWGIQRRKFGIPADEPELDEADLTGADIRNICERAYELACPLTEARRFVVPLKTQSPNDIMAARQMATGRFTDASRGGVYDRQRKNEKPTGRKVSV